MKRPDSCKENGFSIIEIMIALTLGALLIAGIVSLFAGSKSNYTRNEQSARLKENGRTALYFLANDLRHTNFWGILNTTDSITDSPQMSGECSAWANSSSNIFVGDNYSSISNSSGSSTFPTCLSSDIINAMQQTVSTVGTTTTTTKTGLALKRVSSGAVTYSDVNNGNVFLRTNASSGTFYKKVNANDSSGASSPGALPSSTDLSDWLYEPRIYFIRTYTSTGDGIPSLCAIQGNSTLSVECLVEGIEHMRIEYGIDNSGDGVAEYYQTTANGNAIIAKIYLLVREVEKDLSYRDVDTSNNLKTYQLGSAVITPSSSDINYRRAVFSTTVVLQNQRMPSRRW